MVDIEPGRVVQKGRLQPGRMFLVDTAQGRIVGDHEIKATLAAEQPYDEWLHAGMLHLGRLPEREHVVYSHESVRRRQQVFGYTHEELKVIVAPMARAGYEPIGSMGTDTPIAVLSERPRLLFDYFQQLFAQVTNPPLDAIREELVTALGSSVGPEGNLLQPGAGQLPPGHPAVPDHRQRRAGQDHPHQRRRRPARVQVGGGVRPLSRGRGRAGPEAGPGQRAHPGEPGHRGRARGSSCCLIATPTRSLPRSRRCC